MNPRELTGREKQAIRRLVKEMCANFDHEYGCLPLDGTCYMFGVAFNSSSLCRYFRDAVLPLNPELERVLTGSPAPNTKPCKLCGKPFPVKGRQAYCSETCAKTARRKSVAANVRHYRKRRDM